MYILDSYAYEFYGKYPGIITYKFPDGRQPDTKVYYFPFVPLSCLSFSLFDSLFLLLCISLSVFFFLILCLCLLLSLFLCICLSIFASIRFSLSLSLYANYKYVCVVYV